MEKTIKTQKDVAVNFMFVRAMREEEYALHVVARRRAIAESVFGKLASAQESENSSKDEIALLQAAFRDAVKAYELASKISTISAWYADGVEPLKAFLTKDGAAYSTLVAKTSKGTRSLEKALRFMPLSEWIDLEEKFSSCLDALFETGSDGVKKYVADFRKYSVIGNVAEFIRAIGTLRVFTLRRLDFVNPPKGFAPADKPSNGMIKSCLMKAFKAWTGADLSFGSWTVDFIMKTTATYNAGTRKVKLQGDRYFINLFGDVARMVINKCDKLDIIANGSGFEEDFLPVETVDVDKVEKVLSEVEGESK